LIPLIDFLQKYAIYRDIQPSTFDQYRWCVQSFERHLGRPARTGDLTSDHVNEWLAALRGRLSPFTAKSRRTTMLSIWNLAAELGIVDRPRLVRTVKAPRRPIDVLTADQIRQLVLACQSLRGAYCGYAWADLMRTWLLAVVATALRPSDMLSLDWPIVFQAGGSVRITQRKTGHPRTVVLPRHLVSDIALWHAADGPIWPANSAAVYGKRVADLGRRQGIRVTHTLIRKTAISDVEAQRPGLGWVFAGHATPATTQQWYISHTSAYKDIPHPRLWRPE
jgi:integrase